MFGVGSPTAVHSNGTLESLSTTTTPLLTKVNSGGSVKQMTNRQFCTHAWGTTIKLYTRYECVFQK